MSSSDPVGSNAFGTHLNVIVLVRMGLCAPSALRTRIVVVFPSVSTGLELIVCADNHLNDFL